MHKKTITFISHTASRTGAPLLLLKAMQSMKSAQWDCRVLLLEDGPLRKDFAALHPTAVQSQSFFGKLFRRSKPELYYLNSHTYIFLHQAKREGVPAICHVHEVPLSFDQETPETIELLKTYPLSYIAVSQYVVKMLLSMGIEESKIRYCPSGVDVDSWKRKTGGGSLRGSLGIPRTATVVGMSGVVTPLKGVDIWLEMAKDLCTRHREVDWHFVWVGAPSVHDPQYMQYVFSEVQRLGLEQCVHFVGEHEDPRPYYELFDVFTLSSRTESLSLVCIENTLMGTPVIAFAEAGGPQEFGDHGFVELVSSMSAEAMSEAVWSVSQSSERKEKLLQLGKKTIPVEYNISQTAMIMKEEIEKQ